MVREKATGNRVPHGRSTCPGAPWSVHGPKTMGEAPTIAFVPSTNKCHTRQEKHSRTAAITPLTRSVLPFNEVLGMQNPHHRKTTKHATGPNAHQELKDPTTGMGAGSRSHY